MYLQITTTTKTKREATKIADTLLHKKYAACVQIFGPVQSHFLWKGKKEVAREYILFIKTKKTFYKKVEKLIKSLHSYDVQEIIAVPFSQGNESYLKWIDENIGSHQTPSRKNLV